MSSNELPYRCIAEKNMAESLELHVVRAFFAKAEKKSPFSDVSFLPWMHIYEGCRTSQLVSKMFKEQVSITVCSNETSLKWLTVVMPLLETIERQVRD